MPLVAWGYHFDPPRWHALLDRLEAEGRPVLNPVAAAALEQRQAPIWPSLAARACRLSRPGSSKRCDEAALAEARVGIWRRQLVIKPPVSASADGTHRLAPGRPAARQKSRGRPMMVQPFCARWPRKANIRSCCSAANIASIVKRPKAGDYRVQPHLGGSEQPCDAAAGCD